MIRKLMFLFLCFALAGPVAIAGSKEEKVAAAVETLRKAMIDGDSAALAGITMASLSYGHSGGHIQDQATFIKSLTSGNSDFVSMDLTEQTIIVSGNTAIVRHLLNAATNDKGKGPGTVKLAVLLVWQKQHGRWKLLARQAVHLS